MTTSAVTRSEPAADALLARIDLLRARVQRAVIARAEGDPQPPDDPFRGLYISDAHAPHLLRGTPGPLPPDASEKYAASVLEISEREAEAAGATIPLRQLASRFGLSPLEAELLLVAIAPDLDARFERCYGYLNDDVTRRRATIGLALQLCGIPAHSAHGRMTLGATGRLRTTGLLEVRDEERPYAGRELHVPDRVVDHLLGDDTLPPDLRSTLGVLPSPDPSTDSRAAAAGSRLAGLLDGGPPVYLCGCTGSTAEAITRIALNGAERPLLSLDLLTAGRATQPDRLLRAAMLETRLRAGNLLVTSVDALADHSPDMADLLTPLTELPHTVVLAGVRPWNACWSRTIRPLQVRPDGRTVPGRTASAHAHPGSGALDRLARRIRPDVGWTDLVLPERPSTLLHDLTLRARHRERVLLDWKLWPGGGRGLSVSALFSGPSGTGKTLAAEVVAGELGLELCVIDLSMVIDKYIGETEKHLERLFTEAEHAEVVLLFDEADAVFGKRAQTTDSHDRYANIETAYLLQRLESFNGIALLTTNLQSNIDTAFLRRLDLVVPFPRPEAAQRRILWESCLGPALPRAADLDLDRLAEVYDLTGGAIRRCALTAAYRSAETGRPVTTPDLLAAVRDEHLKLGQYFDETRFAGARR